jgi:hypothetical protein
MSLHHRKIQKGCGFRWHENIKHMIRQWFQQQPRKVFAEGICHLATHSATCHITLGDYINILTSLLKIKLR